MGVLLPLLTALPNWLLLATSRIQSALLEDEGIDAMPELPGGENINEVTSLSDEEDYDMLASGLEEVDWQRLVLLNATRALSGGKNIALQYYLYFLYKITSAEPRRRPRRDPSEKPEWNPAGCQARISRERV